MKRIHTISTILIAVCSMLLLGGTSQASLFALAVQERLIEFECSEFVGPVEPGNVCYQHAMRERGYERWSEPIMAPRKPLFGQFLDPARTIVRETSSEFVPPCECASDGSSLYVQTPCWVDERQPTLVALGE